MRKISLHAQRQALGRAIDIQNRIANGQAVRAGMTRSHEGLQLEHLKHIDSTLAWLEENREALIALQAAQNKGGPVR
ncbi:hypothetical protein BA190_27665 [Labrys sp. WJW]|uniref:hypothetical protein n=1 Tax=Labrys sp. WJW TaxID=1737983 RepID=UPI00082BA84D|nr:hypothetical protein [Labrys sp. WJW]OCC01742.1 hypothetical protein BA190_27665 [Labrys sp. WJW]